MTDVLILGGGLAGLSVAEAITTNAPAARITVLESTPHGPAPRGWCWWDTGAPHLGPPPEVPTHRWQRLRTTPDTPLLKPAVPYVHMRSDTWRTAMLHKLATVQVRHGITTGQIVSTSDHATVHTDHGLLAARVVVDARATDGYPPEPPGQPLLWQQFSGWAIETDEDAFDPDIATFMDFSISQEHGPAFGYLLPFTARRALVEPTWLLPEPRDPQWFEDHLDAHIRDHLGISGYTLLEREAGCIPMSGAIVNQRPHERIYRAGTSGGAVKGSSGFGYAATRAQCDRLGRGLAAHLQGLAPLPIPAPIRPRMATWMDRLLLRALGRSPHAPRNIFLPMLGRLSGKRATHLAHFLADEPDMRDYAAMLRATPAAPMLGELLQGPFA